MTGMSEAPAPCGVERRTARPVVEWLRANGIDARHVPDDAELRVDEQAGTITVEQFYFNDGQLAIHGHRALTRLVTVPLLAPPPPGLVEAYQYTIARLREERSAAEAIRRETAEKIAARIMAKGVEIRRSEEASGGDPDAARHRAFAEGRFAVVEEDVPDAMGWPRPASLPLATRWAAER